jgi:polyphenol oxidase
MSIPGPQPSGGFTWVQAPWGTELWCEELNQHAPHIFTTRKLTLREDPEEWRAIAAMFDPLQLVWQVHGTGVFVVRRGEPLPQARPEADIIISNDPSVAVGVRVADCAPILIADARRSAVAAAHAGWRGTVQGVAAVAVRALASEFGSDPRDLVAAIGPCLACCCGEVGPEVAKAFRDAGHAPADLDRWFEPASGDKAMFDLPGANRDQLIAADIPADQIFTAGLCTKTHADHFHSYRAHGAGAGRMLAAIRAG